MHSASVTVLSRYIEWKKVKKQGPVTIQRTTDVHRPFGTDESVPYAHVEIFSIQQTRQIPIYRGLCLVDGHIIFSPSANSS